MKRIMILSFAIVFFSCFHRYDNDAESQRKYAKLNLLPLQEVIVSHPVCTECLDVYIESGNVIVPDYLKKYFPDSLHIHDLFLKGNFPRNYLDVTDWNFEAGKKYKLKGKLIDVDSNNAMGYCPVFYVENYLKLN